MWFLIKGSFWFGLVLVLLSLFSSESSTRLAGDRQIQFSDAFTAVSGAYDYIAGRPYQGHRAPPMAPRSAATTPRAAMTTPLAA